MRAGICSSTPTRASTRWRTCPSSPSISRFHLPDDVAENERPEGARRCILRGRRGLALEVERKDMDKGARASPLTFPAPPPFAHAINV
eukprot:4606838-Pleurochrysis_carterae.AAC.1